MPKTRVVNLKRDPYTLYIGRGSKWGNPFILGRDGHRFQVINKYEMWIRSNDELQNDLHELQGEILGCYCKPQGCHGDVLIKLLEENGLG